MSPSKKLYKKIHSQEMSLLKHLKIGSFFEDP